MKTGLRICGNKADAVRQCIQTGFALRGMPCFRLLAGLRLRLRLRGRIRIPPAQILQQLARGLKGHLRAGVEVVRVQKAGLLWVGLARFARRAPRPGVGPNGA